MSDFLTLGNAAKGTWGLVAPMRAFSLVCILLTKAKDTSAVETCLRAWEGHS